MKPAVAALLLQIAAFPLTLAVTWLLARAGIPMSYLSVALIQGLAAAGLTWWRSLASWWRAIQLLFPVALFGAVQLAIPPPVFLAVFLFLAGSAMGISWGLTVAAPQQRRPGRSTPKPALGPRRAVAVT